MNLRDVAVLIRQYGNDKVPVRVHPVTWAELVMEPWPHGPHPMKPDGSTIFGVPIIRDLTVTPGQVHHGWATPSS